MTATLEHLLCSASATESLALGIRSLSCWKVQVCPIHNFQAAQIFEGMGIFEQNNFIISFIATVCFMIAMFLDT